MEVLDKTGLEYYHNKVKTYIDNQDNNKINKTDMAKIYYATCSTAAATKDKVATILNETAFSLVAGVVVAVKFSVSNTFSANATNHITLNVNNTGAKDIYYAASASNTGTNTTIYGRANYINFYMYDGTNWVWLSSDADNNTIYTNMSAAEATAGTATTARSISSKVMNDLINSKIANKADISALPTKTSDLTNDNGFINNTVNNLTNYTTTTDINNALANKQDALSVQTYYYNDFTYNKIYDTDGETVITEVLPYNTSESNADTPHAMKYGRMVNMTGSLKTVGARTSTAVWLAGYVPQGLEPMYTVKTRQQGSGQNSYLCEVRTNGGIYVSRYGVASNVAVPNNTWLNINMTYISKS